MSNVHLQMCISLTIARLRPRKACEWWGQTWALLCSVETEAERDKPLFYFTGFGGRISEVINVSGSLWKVKHCTGVIAPKATQLFNGRAGVRQRAY